MPEPQNFQVSNFRDGEQLTNALYLSWADPQGGSLDGFALQRCLAPDFNDLTCECIAQLPADQHSYFDTCLDGGIPFYYFLKTYRYHPDPAYRGCSWPAYGDGIAYGGPCTFDQRPPKPLVRSCDSCILRWEDYSWNEDGFIIIMYGEICDTVAPNTVEYTVSNCCTDKYTYHVGAYNEYGVNWSVLGVPCNETPDCEPTLGCEGNQYQVPSMSQWGTVIFMSLIIGSAVLSMLRRKIDVG